MSKIYELRVYTAMPGRLPDLMKRFETRTLKIWDRLGIKQGGFFTTMVGESNQHLTYFLVWDSLAERQQKWGVFHHDAEWLALRAETEKDGQLVANIASSFLQPTSFSSVQ